MSKFLLVELNRHELNAIASTNPCDNFTPDFNPDWSEFKGFATAMWNPYDGSCWLDDEWKYYHLLDTETPPFWKSFTKYTAWWNVTGMSEFALCVAGWIINPGPYVTGLCIKFNIDLTILNTVDYAKINLTNLAYNYEHNYFVADVIATEEDPPGGCCKCCNCDCLNT